MEQRKRTRPGEHAKTRESEAGSAAATHVALLRGINVGGKNKLPMDELVRMLEQEGCAGVRTYIQSGNALFRAAPVLAASLEERLSQRIRRRLGLAVPVVLRTVQELRLVARRNPFLARGADEDELHVAFLADAPAKTAAAALDPRRSPPDEFALVGREIYLRLPGGAARTKLTNAWFDARLSTTSTVRNWRTVLKLIELAN